MKIYPEQLGAQLSKTPAPVYLITGDEVLLANEARDQISQHLEKLDFSERQAFFVERGFDWQQLQDASANLSLFANKKIIELKIPNAALIKMGKDALNQYCQQPPADTVLIITCPKLEKAQQNANWYKAMNQIGIIITIWPLPPTMLPAFVDKRLKQHQLIADQEGVRLLINANEGNLLALSQTINKLALFYPAGKITAAQIASTLNDNARYNVFSLADAVEAGNAIRALRILTTLEQEGSEPTLILWSLTRSLRKLSELSHARQARQPAEGIFRKYQVFPKQQTVVERASQRHRTEKWLTLLSDCAVLDQQIKGATNGNYWQQFKQIIIDASS